ICATHNCWSESAAFAINPGGLRNGCLIFWKLGPPNLIPGLCSPSGRRPQKLFVNNILARRATGAANGAKVQPETGLLRRQGSAAAGHNFASRTGDLDRNWDGEVDAS